MKCYAQSSASILEQPFSSVQYFEHYNKLDLAMEIIFYLLMSPMWVLVVDSPPELKC